MSINLSIIILAAGKSSRMKSATSKILHKLCHKPIINYVTEVAQSLLPVQIISVIAKEQAEISDTISTIQHQQLGTGDAVKTAIPLITEDIDQVLILYGDVPLIKQSTLQLMLTKLKQVDLVMLGFRASDPAEYGRIVVGEDAMAQIIECAELSAEHREVNLCNSGIMAVRAKILPTLIHQINNHNNKGEYYLTDIVKIAYQNKYKCDYVETNEDEVIGINSRQELAKAEQIMQNQLRNKIMAAGVTLLDPTSTFFSYDTVIAQDVTIHPNVVFGTGVKIESNVEIKSFSHIEGAHIKSRAVIGPFARIRPGAVLEEDTHIGNFVEIKNSLIGEGTKANHLSYIGDAVIGKSTNIGAGTITCNYDGQKKHQTIIGDNVFIGSNSAIIAPVVINDRAVIGAGSVINHDVPADMLALARAKQENLIKKKDKIT